MYRLVLMLVSILSAAGAQAGVRGCDVDSDYDLRIGAQELEFTRPQGVPASVLMRGGRLIVDGREVALDPADVRRVAEFEDQVRALVPEVRAIALDAVEIAFAALTEVVRSFSDDSAPALARLERARADLATRVRTADSTAHFDERFVARTVEELVGEVVPLVVGNVVSSAIAAALSGDLTGVHEIEARAARLEREIEARVETGARALEARSEGLCPRLAQLAELDASLEYRHADGRALQLLRMDRRTR